VVVVLVIAAWWFYCGKQAQIAVGAWQAFSSFVFPFLSSSHFAASLPTLFIFSSLSLKWFYRPMPLPAKED